MDASYPRHPSAGIEALEMVNGFRVREANEIGHRGNGVVDVVELVEPHEGSYPAEFGPGDTANEFSAEEPYRCARRQPRAIASVIRLGRSQTDNQSRRSER